jgi:exosortase A
MLPEAIPQSWRHAALQLGIAWLALIAAFQRDWLAMAGQWWNSSTYNHILLVPAIIGWLIWQRLPELVQIEPRASKWGLVPFGLAVLGWVLGSFAGFDLLRQAGATAMLPSVALLVLGPRAFVGLLFPLAYMAFLVPFGDELVAPLQTITAKLVIMLVGLSGVPAEINGVFIDTPAGLFEVAEACSGVKFLIAMIALGALVANIGFRNWKRRAGFMALCVVVPILANGIRAWGTIFAAQYFGIEKAAGIDHLIYGWVFFAVVMAAVLGISWRYFDRSRDEPMIEPALISADPRLERWEGRPVSAAKGLAAAAILVVAGLGWSGAAQSLSASIPKHVHLPEVPGWKRVDYAPSAPWQPAAKGADHTLLGSYSDSSGRRVDVFYALYAAQGEGREAGGFGQGALIPNGEWSWTSSIASRSGSKAELLTYRGAIPRTAHTWYRSGGLLSGSNARLKLINITDRLLLRARPTAVLILSAEGNAEPSIAAFQSAVGELGLWMDRIGEGR